MDKHEEDKTPKACTTWFHLMRQIAGMANMDWSPIKRMVLVLDVDELPKLYVESFLDGKRTDEEFMKQKLLKEKLDVVHADAPVVVNVTDKGIEITPGKLATNDVLETTNAHNKQYRTFAPKPG